MLEPSLDSHASYLQIQRFYKYDQNIKIIK